MAVPRRGHQHPRVVRSGRDGRSPPPATRGIPEDTIRQLKADFGLEHAPLENFFGNWLWWHTAALAHNVARWIETLALPREFRRCRGKRLRLAFFNVAARVVTHARQLWLRLPRSHSWAAAFIEALTRIRRLPTYA